MAPSGHRRNLHPRRRNLHPRRTGSTGSTGDSSTNKIGRTKHCSVWYNLTCMSVTPVRNFSFWFLTSNTNIGDNVLKAGKFT